jgi:hypothetical protein
MPGLSAILDYRQAIALRVECGGRADANPPAVNYAVAAV